MSKPANATETSTTCSSPSPSTARVEGEIRLPRVERALARVERLARLPNGHETILLVEDDGLLRELLVQILDKNSYRVLGAANGEETLEIARRRREPIHLLLTDVVMPGLNGRLVAEQIASPVSRGAGDFPLRVYHRRGDPPWHPDGDDVFPEEAFSALALTGKLREVLEN